MKILVTGATGLLGQSLLREAKKRNYSALTLARRSADFTIDLDDCRNLLEKLQQIPSPLQAIIHTAAITNLDECEKDPAKAMRVNGEAVGILANWAVAKKIPFIQISTDHFFTGRGARPASENEPVVICNEYARSKRRGEELALAVGALVVRTNIVGWRKWQNAPSFVEWVVAQLEERKKFTAFQDVFTSSISADQLAEILFDLLQKKPFPAGILNIGSSTISSKAEFISALVHKGGYDASGMVLGSVKTLPGAPRAESLGLDVSRVESLLGKPMPDLTAVIESLWASRKE